MNETTTDQFLPSFLLDRYRVESILHDDEFGAVVQAIDTRLQRAVAIRGLRSNPEIARSEEYRARKERFAQEVATAARIGFHTNIVPVLDFIIDGDDTQYLVAEFQPGGSLAAHLIRGPLPVPEALRIAADAADALQAAHHAGVVHRDIKPGSLLLTGTGHAKIGGFGLAQIEEHASYTRSIMMRLGSPLYMSPEQEAYLHPATDQYSLGLVLFEMITGTNYKQAIEPERAQLLRQRQPAIADLIARMVERHPEDRFSSMHELAEACRAALGDIESQDAERHWAEESPPTRFPPSTVPREYRKNPLEDAWHKPTEPVTVEVPVAEAVPIPDEGRPARGIGTHGGRLFVVPDAETVSISASGIGSRGARLFVEFGLLILGVCVLVGVLVAYYWR